MINIYQRRMFCSSDESLGTDPRTGEIPLNMAVKVQQRKQYVQELEQRRQRMMQERQESMAMEY